MNQKKNPSTGMNSNFIEQCARQQRVPSGKQTIKSLSMKETLEWNSGNTGHRSRTDYKNSSIYTQNELKEYQTRIEKEPFKTETSDNYRSYQYASQNNQVSLYPNVSNEFNSCGLKIRAPKAISNEAKQEGGLEVDLGSIQLGSQYRSDYSHVKSAQDASVYRIINGIEQTKSIPVVAKAKIAKSMLIQKVNESPIKQKNVVSFLSSNENLAFNDGGAAGSQQINDQQINKAGYTVGSVSKIHPLLKQTQRPSSACAVASSPIVASAVTVKSKQSLKQTQKVLEEQTQEQPVEAQFVEDESKEVEGELVQEDNIQNSVYQISKQGNNVVKKQPVSKMELLMKKKEKSNLLVEKVTVNPVLDKLTFQMRSPSQIDPMNPPQGYIFSVSQSELNPQYYRSVNKSWLNNVPFAGKKAAPGQNLFQVLQHGPKTYDPVY